MKHITVLMPAYNCAKYIGCSVRSILNQTCNDFEFLIVDDGSEDNTEEIIHGFKDSRINYVKTKHGGTAKALNYGTKKASGDWIARIDADDLNVPERLETQIDFLQKRGEFDVISSWSVYFNNKNKVVYFLQDPIEHKEIYKFLNLHNAVNQSSVFYRKNIAAHAKYDEACMFNEDFEFFRRIRDKVKFHNIPEYLSYVRIRSDSKSRVQNNRNIYDFVFPEAIRNLLNSKGKKELYYWTSVIAWINFFYGDKRESRQYFLKSSSLKHFLAYLSTYLPEKYFNKLIQARLRYRIESFFKDKKRYQKQLDELLG